jgi:hypothetical protein
MDDTKIDWTGYMQYRLRMRGFDPKKVGHIVMRSSERYVDTVTGRFVAVGQHDQYLLMIPYERKAEVLTPVTVHVTSRQQINFRIKSGRFNIYE